MRKLFLLCLTLLLLVLAVPAEAHHGDPASWFSGFQGDRWNQSTTNELCLSGDWEVLSNLQYDNVRDTLYSAQERWENNTNVSDTLLFVGTGCGGFNFVQDYANAGGVGAFCADIPMSRPSSVQFEDLAPELVAQAVTCDRNTNGRIDYMVVVVNDDFKNSYNYNYNNNPTSDKPYDLLGLLVHEIGHGLGFTGHPTSTCPETFANWETMCQGSYGDRLGQGSGTASRTIEEHDIGAFNGVYPA